mmetsp:Transcript_107624/g.303091  ORF Transcript_107624/g.303091 Transcript_107624/m.303091 type:complete len:248 (+) Transcript_107624:1096-1839(+)
MLWHAAIYFQPIGFLLHWLRLQDLPGLSRLSLRPCTLQLGHYAPHSSGRVSGIAPLGCPPCLFLEPSARSLFGPGHEPLPPPLPRRQLRPRRRLYVGRCVHLRQRLRPTHVGRSVSALFVFLLLFLLLLALVLILLLLLLLLLSPALLESPVPDRQDGERVLRLAEALEGARVRDEVFYIGALHAHQTCPACRAHNEVEVLHVLVRVRQHQWSLDALFHRPQAQRGASEHGALTKPRECSNRSLQRA